METEQNILKRLLKDFTARHTVTSLAKEAGLSRVGAWKLLKRLESEKLIVISAIGSGKTSTCTISLNWNNILTKKKLELYLAEEAQKSQRWIVNFAELEKELSFLILYGSILHSQKEAKDIDILGIVSNKHKFVQIEKIISKIQKTQIKRIHAINLTENELKSELLKPNRPFIEAIKKRVILFGHANFINFIRKVR